MLLADIVGILTIVLHLVDIIILFNQTVILSVEFIDFSIYIRRAFSSHSQGYPCPKGSLISEGVLGRNNKYSWGNSDKKPHTRLYLLAKTAYVQLEIPLFEGTDQI